MIFDPKDPTNAPRIHLLSGATPTRQCAPIRGGAGQNTSNGTKQEKQVMKGREKKGRRTQLTSRPLDGDTSERPVQTICPPKKKTKMFFFPKTKKLTELKATKIVKKFAKYFVAFFFVLKNRAPSWLN